jgi:hypothetical protein
MPPRKIAVNIAKLPERCVDIITLPPEIRNVA